MSQILEFGFPKIIANIDDVFAKHGFVYCDEDQSDVRFYSFHDEERSSGVLCLSLYQGFYEDSFWAENDIPVVWQAFVSTNSINNDFELRKQWGLAEDLRDNYRVLVHHEYFDEVLTKEKYPCLLERFLPSSAWYDDY